MNITNQDKALLVNFYESEEYKGLRRVMAARQEELAREAILCRTLEDLAEKRGRVLELKWLGDTLEATYKSIKKRSK